MSMKFTLEGHCATKVRYGYLNKHFFVTTNEGQLLKLNEKGTKQIFVIHNFT